MITLRIVGVLAVLLLAPGCSVFSGAANRDASAARDALASELQTLRAENARLAEALKALKRQNEQLSERLDGDAPNNEIAALEDEDAVPVKSVFGSRPLRTNGLRMAKDDPAPLDVNEAPVQESPRLVQPTFASSEAVFENEAHHVSGQDLNALFGVHLASYRAIDEARAGWRKLQRENPDELGLLEPRLERVVLPERGEFLRLIGGGFSSEEKAAALCLRLKQKNLYCAIAPFEGERLTLDPSSLSGLN